MSVRSNGIEFIGGAGSVMWYAEKVMTGGEDLETKRVAQLINMRRNFSWKTCIIQDCYNSRQILTK